MYMYEQFKFIVMNSQKRVAAGGWGGGVTFFSVGTRSAMDLSRSEWVNSSAFL